MHGRTEGAGGSRAESASALQHKTEGKLLLRPCQMVKFFGESSK